MRRPDPSPSTVSDRKLKLPKFNPSHKDIKPFLDEYFKNGGTIKLLSIDGNTEVTGYPTEWDNGEKREERFKGFSKKKKINQEGFFN